ncbi:zinc finger domain-containing protein [Bacillus sp. BHET2]|uniref:zinc finger domain-containing protein n=1 Tax=Bacillus sp. BHET2 TaxID=2583818 RepID=UPI001F0E9628|nr:zinc finger domain-containing protein [Bacillus sp. BHET2]
MPSLRPVDCTEQQWKKAAIGIIDLVKQSYETGGITNDLSLVQKLHGQGVKRSRYRHWVFNREGESCFICGSEIEKTVAASRRLYYCPVCQGLDG